MALRHKILYSLDPVGLTKYNLQVQLNVIGIFNTYKVHWDYYAASTITTSMNEMQLTDDICSGNFIFNIEKIKFSAIKFDDIEDAKKYIDDFKIKWETASNNTIQETRDQKLKELEL